MCECAQGIKYARLTHLRLRTLSARAWVLLEYLRYFGIAEYRLLAREISGNVKYFSGEILSRNEHFVVLRKLSWNRRRERCSFSMICDMIYFVLNEYQNICRRVPCTRSILSITGAIFRVQFISMASIFRGIWLLQNIPYFISSFYIFQYCHAYLGKVFIRVKFLLTIFRARNERGNPTGALLNFEHFRRGRRYFRLGRHESRKWILPLPSFAALTKLVPSPFPELTAVRDLLLICNHHAATTDRYPVYHPTGTLHGLCARFLFLPFPPSPFPTPALHSRIPACIQPATDSIATY